MAKASILLIGTGTAATRLAGLLGATLLDLDAGDVVTALSDPFDLILFVGIPDVALRPAAFETLSDADWHEGVDRPLERLLATLHALGDRYRESPPPIVLLGPSVALSGGEGLSLLAAAAEGQRALMKSAARQWGSRGFRLTWVAIDPLLFGPELGGATLPRSQDPDPLATGGPPTIEQLVDLLSLLAEPRAKAVIGQSLVLDGGELMLP